MEIKSEDFFEKKENKTITNDNKTKGSFSKNDYINSNNIRKDVLDKIIDFEKEGEIINKEDFDEDNKEENIMLKTILEDLNKNILINVKEQEVDQKQKAIDELLELFKYPHSDKNIRMNASPFKPLFQPKIVSMVGRVFYNSTDNNDNMNSTKDNTNSCNNNGGIVDN